MMKNYDELVIINNNPNWPYFDEHFFRTVIIGVLGSVRTNMILNLIKHQRTDIDKMSKIHYLSTKRKSRNQKILKKNQKHSLMIHKQFMMSMKIWKNIIQQRK